MSGLAPLVRWMLRARSIPLLAAAERRVRALPPVNRAAKRAYARYKQRELTRVTQSPEVRAAMLGSAPLPPGYGRGMDERIVEYAWVLPRLPADAGVIFDAGSTLNFEWIADHPALQGKRVHVYTLAPEGVLKRTEYTYDYGDLRAIPLGDALVDAVVCISTLEHVGMDNRVYTGSTDAWVPEPDAYLDVVHELRRVLRPGAPLLVTVPYGAPTAVGWLRQFDAEGLAAIQATFAGERVAADFFRHDPAVGWQRSTAADSADAEFVYEVDPRTGASLATMATAIACLHLVRSA